MNKTFGVATKGIVYKDDKFLIVLKSDSEDINPNSYEFPGGRLVFGEMLDEALKREIKEETGLEVEIEEVINAWTFTKEEKGFQLVGVDYLCKFTGGTDTLSEEHSSIEWKTFDEIMSNEEYPDWLKSTLQKAQNVLKAKN